MTFYNAIILDEKQKIVGRTHVTNLTLSRFSSPSSKWIACHEGGKLMEQLPSKLIGPHNPITIMKGSGGRYFNLEIETLTGNTYTFFLTADTTVEELKTMVYAKEEIPLDQQRLVYDSNQLQNDYRLVDYNIVSDSKIRLVLNIRGGGMNMKDLEGEWVTGFGKPMDSKDKDLWKGFSIGFNIIGKCDNKDCKSNKIGRQPILKRGLTYFRLTGDPLYCPACKCKAFHSTNFLVAGARSAINFRRSGETQIRSTLLESPGLYPKFAKYAESNETVEYEEIEVKTTDLDASPFFCNLCATFIMHRNSEAGQPCGHYFHKKCTNNFKDCPICNADLLIGEAVENLFEF